MLLDQIHQSCARVQQEEWENSRSIWLVVGWGNTSNTSDQPWGQGRKTDTENCFLSKAAITYQNSKAIHPKTSLRDQMTIRNCCDVQMCMEILVIYASHLRKDPPDLSPPTPAWPSGQRGAPQWQPTHDRDPLLPALQRRCRVSVLCLGRSFIQRHFETSCSHSKHCVSL